MSRVTAKSLYEEVVGATAIYLGPAADRFISRQVINHLHKAPEKLMRGDLIDLIKWLKPAIAILTDDPAMVDEYVDRLNNIAGIRSRSN